MKRRLPILSLCLVMGLILNACSGINQPVPEPGVPSSTADTTATQSVETIAPSQTTEETTETTETLPGYENESKVEIVAVKDKVYEGRYFDEGVYMYVDMPESESPLIYCEIIVSNVTDTSFDFTIYETVMATGESELILSTNTAVFIEDGSKAAYFGEDQTLYFFFNDEPELYPKHMEIQGLEKAEGKTYINNTIPGHESG